MNRLSNLPSLSAHPPAHSSPFHNSARATIDSRSEFTAHTDSHSENGHNGHNEESNENPHSLPARDDIYPPLTSLDFSPSTSLSSKYFFPLFPNSFTDEISIEGWALFTKTNTNS